MHDKPPRVGFERPVIRVVCAAGPPSLLALLLAVLHNAPWLSFEETQVTEALGWRIAERAAPIEACVAAGLAALVVWRLARPAGGPARFALMWSCALGVGCLAAFAIYTLEGWAVGVCSLFVGLAVEGVGIFFGLAYLARFGASEQTIPRCVLARWLAVAAAVGAGLLLLLFHGVVLRMGYGIDGPAGQYAVVGGWFAGATAVGAEVAALVTTRRRRMWP